MADEKKPELTLESLTELIKGLETKVTEQINGYDKKLEKTIQKHLTPVIEDLQSKIKSGIKPKKLAKMMRKIEAAKLAEAADGKAKDGKQKTADEIAAEAAAAAGKGKNKDDDRPDLFKKQQFREMEGRVATLEAATKAAEAKAASLELTSALDRALSDFPWANTDSLDLARGLYLPRLKRDAESGEIMIGEQPFVKVIKAEIETRYENLLAPVGKGGSGAARSTTKANVIDLDSLNASSTPEQLREAAKAAAALL